MPNKVHFTHDTSADRLGYPAQFGMLLTFFGIGIILSAALLVGYIFITDKSGAIDFAHIDLESLAPRAFRAMQAIGSIIQFALPALGLAFIMKKRPLPFFRLSNFPAPSTWIYVLALAILGTAFSDLLARANEAIPLTEAVRSSFLKMEEAYFSQIFKIVDFSSFGAMLVTLLIVALLPAFFEELLFRGALQPILSGWTKSAFWGIIITSLFFSLLHISFFGFLPRFFLGVALGYIFYWSKSLWASIFFHFLNNAIAVVTFYIFSLQGNLSYSKATEHLPLLYAFPASILFILTFYLFYKDRLRVKP